MGARRSPTPFTRHGQHAIEAPTGRIESVGPVLSVRLDVAFTSMSISDTNRHEPGTVATEHLLTVPEICARLGISLSTFYDWRQAHKAPPCLVLPNAQIRVRETDFAQWVNGRMETTS